MITGTSFLDSDLSNIPPGQGAGLIELPADKRQLLHASLPTFEAARPGAMVPKSEWKDRSQRLLKQYRNDVTEIYSQGNFGSCVGFGSAQCLETTLRRRYGLPHRVSLSGMSVYKRIGNGPNSGAMISDGMDAICKEGALPTDTAENKAKYPHTHPLRSWTTPLPQGWRETAKLFRGASFAVAEGLDQICSALINGFIGIVGRQSHCVPYVYLDYSGNDPCAAFANSWDKDWNDAGFGYDSAGILRSITLYVLLDVVTRPDLELPEVG